MKVCPKCGGTEFKIPRRAILGISSECKKCGYDFIDKDFRPTPFSKGKKDKE